MITLTQKHGVFITSEEINKTEDTFVADLSNLPYPLSKSCIIGTLKQIETELTNILKEEPGLNTEYIGISKFHQISGAYVSMEREVGEIQADERHGDIESSRYLIMRGSVEIDEADTLEEATDQLKDLLTDNLEYDDTDYRIVRQEELSIDFTVDMEEVASIYIPNAEETIVNQVDNKALADMVEVSLEEAIGNMTVPELMDHMQRVSMILAAKSKPTPVDDIPLDQRPIV